MAATPEGRKTNTKKALDPGRPAGLWLPDSNAFVLGDLRFAVETQGPMPSSMQKLCQSGQSAVEIWFLNEMTL
ncbi:MAG: hypothetical protein ACWA6Y_05720 [Polaromonas sp.]